MSIPRDLWVEIAGTGRSQPHQLGVQRGSRAARRHRDPGAGHPDPPLRRGRLRRLQADRRRARRRRAVRRVRHPRHSQRGSRSSPGASASTASRRSRSPAAATTRSSATASSGARPRADLGRIERQQFFIRSAVDGTLRKIESSPFGSGEVIDAVVSAVRIDDRLDPIRAGEALRRAAEEGLRTFSLPVVDDTSRRCGRAPPRGWCRDGPRLLPRSGAGPGGVRDHHHRARQRDPPVSSCPIHWR
jgi:hypothetical protein